MLMINTVVQRLDTSFKAFKYQVAIEVVEFKLKIYFK